MTQMEDLSEAEQRLWDAYQAGDVANFLEGDTELDEVRNGLRWGLHREIRAEVVMALLNGAADSDERSITTVRLRGARIIGALGTSEAKLTRPLYLEQCYLADGIRLKRAETRSIDLINSYVGSVHLDEARVEGSVNLTRSILQGNNQWSLSADRLWLSGSLTCIEMKSYGGILATNATIEGAVNFSTAYIDGQDREALRAAGLRVKGSMFCGNQFQTSGSVVLGYANIGMMLVFSNAKLDGKGKSCISAARLKVGGDMFCSELDAQGGITLSSAVIDGLLSFQGAHIRTHSGAALSAASLRVGESLLCSKKFHAEGSLDLRYARIGAELELNNAELNGKGEDSIIAIRINIVGDMNLTGLKSAGRISLTGAEIGASLILGDTRVNGNGRESLAAGNITVNGNLLGGGLVSTGTVNVSLSSIRGSLAFDKCELNGDGANALAVTGTSVGGSGVFARLNTNGQVDLSGSKFGNSISFQNARLSNRTGPSLIATRCTAGGDVDFTDMTADGSVVLTGANLAAGLLLTGVKVDGKGQKAIGAAGIHVSGIMGLEKCRLHGVLDLFHATVGESLTLNGAYLDGGSGDAMMALKLQVGGHLSFTGDFEARGAIVLRFAQVEGPLTFNKSSIICNRRDAISAEGLSVAGYMYFSKMHIAGAVNFANANVGFLSDDLASWPDSINIDGLAYEDISASKIKDRLGWLTKSSDFTPQPYEQLAAHYRKLGSDRDARRALLAKQRVRRKRLPVALRAWGLLQDGAVGYGYAPGRALILLVVSFLGGYLFFRSCKTPLPTNPATHPIFNAALYSLDVLVPAGGIGNSNSWSVGGVELAVTVGLHVVGWLLTVAVIAAVTRSLSRN